MSDDVKADRKTNRPGTPSAPLSRFAPSSSSSTGPAKSLSILASQTTSPPGLGQTGAVETAPGSATPLTNDAAIDGSTHRVDESHFPQRRDESFASSESVKHPAEFSTASPSVSPAPPESTPISSKRSHDEDLLLQASQIAEHLRARFSELDRREQSLNEQLAQLDQERRNVRFWVHETEEEMNDRERAIRVQETALAEKIAACEKLTADMGEQEQALVDLRDQLEAQRAGLKEELGREMATERNALERAQQAVQTERELLEAQQEQYRREQQEALAQLQQQHEIERGGLREELAAELDVDRAEFARQKSEWTELHAAQINEITRERELSDAATRRTEEELTSLHEKLNSEVESSKTEQFAEIENQREALLSAMRSEREAFERDLAKRQQEWAAVRDAEMAEIECNREIGEAAVNRSAAELETLHATQKKEIEVEREQYEQQFREAHEQLVAEREQREQQLREEREQFEAERDQQLAHIKKERALLDNRVRFQQEHLRKSREEFETAHSEFRIERQKFRLDEEQSKELLRLRTIQFEHYRAVIDERDASFRREQQLVSKSRQTFEADIARERKRLSGEREAWEQERDAQRAEIRRQQDMLALHAENLEGRRSRLDQLRNELEETHRDTLEMRMAVEEAWAQLMQSAGTQPAIERFENARKALSDHYRHIREAIAQQRQELIDAQTLFQHQKDEFRDEGQKLTEWVAQRDEKLRNWEERLAHEAQTVESREADGRSIREEWVQEKIQAEQIIRELLAQLAELTAPSDAAVAPIEISNSSAPLSEPDAGRVGGDLDPCD